MDGIKVHEVELKCKECKSVFAMVAAHECTSEQKKVNDNLLFQSSPSKSARYSKDKSMDWVKGDTLEYLNIVI